MLACALYVRCLSVFPPTPPTPYYIHDSPQIRKLYQKATRIIPESLYKAEAQSPALISIWLGFAAAERYVHASVRCAACIRALCSGTGSVRP